MPDSIYEFKLLYRLVESGDDLIRECRTILNESGQKGSVHYHKSVLAEYLPMLFDRIEQWRKQIIYCLSFKRIQEAKDDLRVKDAEDLIKRVDDAKERLQEFASK